MVLGYLQQRSAQRIHLPLQCSLFLACSCYAAAAAKTGPGNFRRDGYPRLQSCPGASTDHQHGRRKRCSSSRAVRTSALTMRVSSCNWARNVDADAVLHRSLQVWRDWRRVRGEPCQRVLNGLWAPSLEGDYL
jgi:hypothetical protein